MQHLQHVEMCRVWEYTQGVGIHMRVFRVRQYTYDPGCQNKHKRKLEHACVCVCVRVYVCVCVCDGGTSNAAPSPLGGVERVGE